MEIFLAGTAVTLTVPLQDRHGNKISATSVDYRLLDHNDVELVARTNIADFTADSDEAVIEINGTINQIAVGAVSEVRSVELFLLVDGNTVVINSAYMVEVADPLVVGVNSFQSYALSQLTATQLAKIPNWDEADEKDRISALIEARHRIIQLGFRMLAQAGVNASAGGSSETFSLQDLTAVQFVSLDSSFKGALRLAQVAEADVILGGDSVDIRRKEGLVLETIGEVKQMFRSGKPLSLPVSRRTLGYLSAYVTFAKGIGRA